LHVAAGHAARPKTDPLPTVALICLGDNLGAKQTAHTPENRMNRNSDSQPRSRWDFVHFAVIIVGLWLSLAGIATLSKAVAIVGVVLMAYGFLYFAFQQWIRGDGD
jgi:hypothetical protein